MPATLNRNLVTVVALLTLTACAPAVTINQQSEQAAIRAAGLDWQQGAAAKDVNRIAAHFAPDIVIMTPNAAVIRGSDAARKLWTDEVALPGLAVSWVPDQIEITSPTTATEIGTYKFAFDSPNGRVNDTGSYVSHWRKIDGRWRMTADAIISSTPAPPPTCK